MAASYTFTATVTNSFGQTYNYINSQTLPDTSAASIATACAAMAPYFANIMTNGGNGVAPIAVQAATNIASS